MRHFREKKQHEALSLHFLNICSAERDVVLCRHLSSSRAQFLSSLRYRTPAEGASSAMKRKGDISVRKLICWDSEGGCGSHWLIEISAWMVLKGHRGRVCVYISLNSVCGGGGGV